MLTFLPLILLPINCSLPSTQTMLWKYLLPGLILPITAAEVSLTVKATKHPKETLENQKPDQADEEDDDVNYRSFPHLIGVPLYPDFYPTATDVVNAHLLNGTQQAYTQPNYTDLEVDPLFATTNDETLLHAYDCSRPYNLQTVNTASDEECRKQTIPIQARTKEFLLLQSPSYTRVPMRRCSVKRTIIPMFCGDHDHQAMAKEHFHLQVPVTMSWGDCERMWNTKKYTYDYWDPNDD